MKNILFLNILFSLFFLAFTSQNTVLEVEEVAEVPEVAIQVVRGGDLIHKMNNALKIVVENLPCEAILVKTTGLHKENSWNHEGCDLTVYPLSQGSMLFQLYQLQNQDTIFLKEQYIRVRAVEAPTAMIGKQKDGKMKAGELKVQQGVRAIIFDDRFSCTNIKIPILRYRVLVIRPEEGTEERVIGTVQNEGAHFQEKSRALIDQIQAGDRIYILDIYYKNIVEKIEESLNTIVLEVE